MVQKEETYQADVQGVAAPKRREIVSDLQSAIIAATLAGDTQVVAAVAGRQIRLVGYDFSSDAAVSIRFRDDALVPNNLTGAFPTPVDGGRNFTAWPGYVGETSVGQALLINLSVNAVVGGVVIYEEI